MNILDAYFKKTVSYNYRGNNLIFRVSQSLFSSQQIDFGTQRLLRTLIAENFNVGNKVLDLGCGYGPIGIALKSVYRSSVVNMVDRDALALEYSRQNAKLNNINNINIYATLGYDDVVETDFDLIISNIPAKVGEKALAYILQNARFHLRRGGHVIVVVIDPIVEYVDNVLSGDPNIKIHSRKAWSGHVVFHYEFLSNALPKKNINRCAFDKGVFDREQKVFSFGALSYTMKTVYDLPEFDTLSYRTELLLEGIKILQNLQINKAIIFNPSQGHIPVVLSLSANVKEIILIDRDLLALRVSKRNLLLNGYSLDSLSLIHQVGILQTNSKRIDCIMGILIEKDGQLVHKKIIEQAILQLTSGGLLILSSSSTAITRAEEFIRRNKLLDVVDRKRSKGNSVIILKKKT